MLAMSIIAAGIVVVIAALSVRGILDVRVTGEWDLVGKRRVSMISGGGGSLCFRTGYYPSDSDRHRGAGADGCSRRRGHRSDYQQFPRRP